MAAVALGAQWLFARSIDNAPFAPFSAASWLIRHTPGGLATEAIERLQHNAIRVLEAGAIVAALALGAILGRRRPTMMAALVVALSLVTAPLDPFQPGLGLSAASAVVAGLAAFLAAASLTPVEGRSKAARADRRRLILGGLGLAFAGLGGTAIIRSRRSPALAPVRADEVAVTTPTPGFPDVEGLSPAITPTKDHYVVEIDIASPVVDGGVWQLKVHGEVAQEATYSLAQLQAMPTVQRPVLVSCISNLVGGSLVGNALWTSVPLWSLIAPTHPPASVSWVLTRSADGYYESMSVADAMNPDVHLAFGMAGADLPIDHGFPARVLVPGHYGMRGAKWLTEIVLATDNQDGYWEERGWDHDAPMRTESRFDVPSDGARVTSPVTVAGVAWAGVRGISKVEVSADDGATWVEAQLEDAVGPLAWRRWATSLPLRAGSHGLVVRATDGTGTLQDPVERPPHPTGASGYHRISVSVV